MEQLNLGELIEKIESFNLMTDYLEENEDKTVEFDFASAIPTTLDSWRGDYSQLALGFRLSGYDSDEDHHASITAKDLLTELKGAIGKSYYGWKGGDYTMSKSTDVWVTNSGNCGHTVITNVIDAGYKLILETRYEAW